MNANEIAKLAGVSRSTVTRVVNDYPDISEKTRKKVMDVIEKYQYAPDSSARILAGKQAQEIGLFMGIDKDNKISSSLYYGEIITYAIDKAEERGYSLLTSTIRDGDYSNVAKLLNANGIQGAIIIGNTKNTNEIESIKKSHKIIFVEQFDENQDITKYYGLTNIDNCRGAFLATEYLIKQGHTNIMHITRSDEFVYVEERVKGYKNALLKNGIEIRDELILRTGLSDDFLEKLILDYLKTYNMPSAIFAATDLMAIEIIKILKKNNYHVPNDISVVGFDNIYISDSIEPRLTTVHPDIRNMIYKTVDEIINSIENGTVPKTIKISDLEVIERDSVKKMI